jgi:hypothetical protein
MPGCNGFCCCNRTQRLPVVAIKATTPYDLSGHMEHCTNNCAYRESTLIYPDHSAAQTQRLITRLLGSRGIIIR